MDRLLFSARSRNPKTGDIPTAWAGSGPDRARETCRGCPLLPVREGGRADASRGETTCYAWEGALPLAHLAVAKAARARPDAYTAEGALRARSASARAVRFTGLGDVARVDRRVVLRDVATVRAAGLATIAYTHHWQAPFARHLRKTAMASCDTIAGAVDAITQGWIPAVVVREARGPRVRLSARHEAIVCPAQRKPHVTCNACRLCDPSNPYWARQDRARGVAFIDHGPAARKGARS